MQNNTPTTPILLNLKDAAAYLAICAPKLSSLAKEKRVPSLKIDRCFRFDRADLDTFIQNMKEGVR